MGPQAYDGGGEARDEADGDGAVQLRLAWGPADRAAALALREEVFVREQGVPAALEVDEHDAEGAPAAVAVAARRTDGAVVGCLRLREAHGLAKVERVAVRRVARGLGIGHGLMRFAEAEAARRWPRALLFLHAQEGALAFYRDDGYAPLGGSFDDAGIPHRAMAKLTDRGGAAVALDRLAVGPAPAEARAIILAALAEHGLAAEAYDADLDDLASRYADGAFFVLREGAAVLGTGAWAPHGEGVAEIRRMFLAPVARGRGVGEKLLLALELDAAYSGRTRATLETASALGAAIALYQRAGYARSSAPCETRRCDLRMEKALPRAPVS
jgi:predicted GNAT family N-acyltransferase